MRYLALVVLAAVLTLPPWWSGLQPIDGWIMFAAYLAYLANAMLRRREERDPAAIYLVYLGAVSPWLSI